MKIQSMADDRRELSSTVWHLNCPSTNYCYINVLDHVYKAGRAIDTHIDTWNENGFHNNTQQNDIVAKIRRPVHLSQVTKESKTGEMFFTQAPLKFLGRHCPIERSNFRSWARGTCERLGEREASGRIDFGGRRLPERRPPGRRHRRICYVWTKGSIRRSCSIGWLYTRRESIAIPSTMSGTIWNQIGEAQMSSRRCYMIKSNSRPGQNRSR